MALTQAQALAALRLRLDESSATFWPDATLNAYINEAVKDLARRTESNMKSSGNSASWTAGVSEFALTTLWSSIANEVARIYRLEWNTTGETQRRALEYRDFNNMDEIWWEGQNISTGKPMYFTVVGYPPNLTIRLYPTPSDAGVVIMQYYEIPDTSSYSGSTTLEVPGGFEDLILDYAEYRAFRQDRDERWTSAFQVYEANVERMIEQTRRYVDANGMIANGTSMLPQWLYGGDGYY